MFITVNNSRGNGRAFFLFEFPFSAVHMRSRVYTMGCIRFGVFFA